MGMLKAKLIEMRENEHGIIVLDVLAHMVFLQDLATWDRPDDIWSFRVHQVYLKILRPAMFFQQLQMGISMVTDTGSGITICGIALHDSATDIIFQNSGCR